MVISHQTHYQCQLKSEADGKEPNYNDITF